MRRLLLVAAWGALGLVPAARPAKAETLYVNNLTGNDRFDGSRATVFNRRIGPVRTIGRALQVARPSDTIDVARTGDPYTEELSVATANLHGDDVRPLTLECHGAVLEGARPIDPQRWEYVHNEVYRFRPAHTQFQALMLDYTRLTRVAVSDESAPRPELQPLQWCSVRGWIYFRVRPGEPIDAYALQVYGGQTGLTILDVDHVTVRNLVIQHFRIDGVHATGRARAIRLENVISRENGRAGLVVSGAARVTAIGCQFPRNGLRPTITQQRGRLTLTAPAAPPKDHQP